MTAPTFEPAWPIEKLIPAPDNPRKDLGDLKELAESIAATGIVEPIVATTTAATADAGELLIVAGHRRRAAAEKAGLATAPVMVHQQLSDDVRLLITISENLARADLTPTEEGEAYRRMTVDLKVSQRELERRLGVSQAHISRRMKLLKLPEKARVAVDNRSIKVELAVKLAGLPDKAVKKLFGSGEHVPSEWEIDSAIRSHERQQKVVAAKEAAEKAGLKVVDQGVVGYQQKATYLTSWGEVPWVDADAHVSETCHAVVIDHSGETKPVCLEPANHLQPADWKAQDEEDSDLDEEPAPDPRNAEARARWETEQTARKAELEAFRAAAGRRIESCRRLLEDPPMRTEFLLRALATYQPFDMLPFKEAAALLGLDASPYEVDDDYDHYAERRAFMALIDEDGPDRAAYALALAHGESAVPDRGYIELDPERDAEQLSLVSLYLHHLAGDGDYTPTAQELVWMGETPAGEFDPAQVKITGKGRKWRVVCSACGPEYESAVNTTEAYAEDTRQAHLETVHGLAPAEVA